MNFRSYVMSKGIYEFEKTNKASQKDYTEEKICNHINVICDLHERLKECSIPTINLTNKMVEDFKVAELFLRQDIERYKIDSKNKFEMRVSKLGPEVLERIRKVLSVIEQSNYESIVLRSLKNKEICVYNVSLNQICEDGNSHIYVKNINEFCENILEYDYIKFLTKIKRMTSGVDFLKCCAYICSKEEFGIDSYNFILASISFPYEFTRVISKYRDFGRHLSNFSNEIDFDDVFQKDGESLV